MNFPSTNNDEFDALLDQLTFGEPTAEQVARIEELAIRDPAIFDRYIRWSATFAGLRSCDLFFEENAISLDDVPLAGIGLSANDAPLQGVPSILLSGWPLAYFAATVILGIGLAIAGLTYVSLPSGMEQRIAIQAGDAPRKVAVSPSSPALGSVGQITDMVSCVWEQARSHQQRVGSPRRSVADHSLATGDFICLGDLLSLHSGVMEITYDSGAKVVLQGPVTYEVDSATGGYLAIGKLAARVTKKADASPFASPRLQSPLFCIRTPLATVTDLGTEFGVEVDNQGHTVSYVFQGAVEVSTIATSKSPVIDRRILHANESAEVAAEPATPNLRIATVAVDATRFLRPRQLRQESSEAGEKAFRRWQAFSKQLREDPSLIAYYDFQRNPGKPKNLTNVAANGDRSADGTIQNAVWVHGRASPEKNAVLFRRRSDRIELDLQKATDDLTLSAWVFVNFISAPTTSESGYSGLLMSSDWNDWGRVHWQLRNDGCVGFTIAGAGFLYQKDPSFTIDQLQRWKHVASVYDHKTRNVRIFVDGQLTDETTLEKHVPVRFGPCWIGQWNGFEAGRNLHGCIDELAVFSRPLSDIEVRRIFDAGRPPDRSQAEQKPSNETPR